MIINLLSDTVTKPSLEMRQAMMNAEVGDDVFGQDPSVNALQDYAAQMFGKEAALYCPSGTMTNQIAIKTHTQAMEELICDKDAHVYQYENGGYAFTSRISANIIDGSYGKITPDQIEAAIRPDYDWLPKSRLVVIENTCNKGGGSIYRKDEMKAIADLCQAKQLKLHLDGARLFNALVETKDAPNEIATHFDSISICLSKGLGAPVGSLLIGDSNFIKRARKFRKALGGGMRQAGIIAAGGLYALQNNIDRLAIDNKRAKELGALLKGMSYVKKVNPVESNIAIFYLRDDISNEMFLRKLENEGIYASAMAKGCIRLITHLDIDEHMIEKVKEVLTKISFD